MFSHVLQPASARRTRFGWGAALSAAVHLGLLGLVLSLTHRAPPVKEDLTEVHFAASPAPPPPPATLTRRVAAARPARADRFLAPREVPREQPPEAPPPGELGGPGEDAPPGAALTGEPLGVEGGDPRVPPEALEPEQVISFEQGMTRPEIDVTELQRGLYPREALEAQVQGSVIVKCQVLATGVIQRCRVLKPLPLLDQAVVARLQTMRVGPARVEGRPISIDYVFHFRFVAPR